MSLDIFFAEDIRNALLAADEASSATARVCAAVGGDPVTLRAYLEGYDAALRTVALAFGLSPAVIRIARRFGEALMVPEDLQQEEDQGEVNDGVLPIPYRLRE